MIDSLVKNIILKIPEERLNHKASFSMDNNFVVSHIGRTINKNIASEIEKMVVKKSRIFDHLLS